MAPQPAAGLRSGDIVVAMDATPVTSRAQLDREVATLAAGRIVKLSVRRAAVVVRVRVKLGEEPDEWRLPPALADAKRLLGIEAHRLTPTVGVVAADVESASPAARAGLEPGDILREVNRRTIRTIADFQMAIRSVGPRAPVLLLIQRGDVALYVVIDSR